MDKPSSRPLGLLVVWLISCDHLATFEDHQDKLYMRCIPWERRAECREWLRKVEGGAMLLSYERKKKPDEKEEPAGIP